MLSTPAGPSVLSAPAGPSVLSGSRPGVRRAAFEVSGPATTVKVRIAPLGGALYRVSTPADSATLASAALTADTVRVTLADSGRRGVSSVDIVLDESVQWSIRVGSAVRQGEIDVADGRTGAIVLAGDAADMGLTLGSPRDVQAVRVVGGINRLRISVPRAAPVRVRARGGAGRATVDGRTVTGMARNSSVQSPGWHGDAGGVDVDAVAGLGAVRVDHRGD